MQRLPFHPMLVLAIALLATGMRPFPFLPHAHGGERPHVHAGGDGHHHPVDGCHAHHAHGDGHHHHHGHDETVEHDHGDHDHGVIVHADEAPKIRWAGPESSGFDPPPIGVAASIPGAALEVSLASARRGRPPPLASPAESHLHAIATIVLRV